jgi:hypothetical protein
VIDYLAGFGVSAISIGPAGEVNVCSPAGLSRRSIATVFWVCDRATAHSVVMALGEQQPASVEQAIAEVVSAASRLGAVLSPHSVVLERAKAAVDKLATRLDQAQDNGALAFFNREFRRRRIEAQRQGRTFMPYPTALSRLRKALAGAAATGSMPDLMRAVFDAPAKP